MKKIAIIGGGYMAGIFAQNAREMNVETHCFSLENGIVNKECFDYVHMVNILEQEKVLEVCKRIQVNGVVATTELTISVAAFVAEQMNLRGIPFNIAEQITDKYRNRIVTQNIDGLSHPRYSEIYSIDEIKNLQFEYPIILKPTSKGGKRGIAVIYEEKEIESAFEYTMMDSGGQLPFIVEEYIDGGIECSVESLTYNGSNYIIQVTEKITSGPPHCVELAHHQPAAISKDIRKQLENVLDKSLTAIGITNGPCHTEVKIKDDKIFLIEFNARPGGDHIASPLTELSTGYPYIKGAIEIALDMFQPVIKSDLLSKCAGVVFVAAQTSELKKVFDECENYSWCYKKNHISDELQSIIHNDGFNTNYFIYLDDSRPHFNQ